MDTFKCLFKLLFEAQNMYVFINISAIRENIFIFVCKLSKINIIDRWHMLQFVNKSFVFSLSWLCYSNYFLFSFHAGTYNINVSQNGTVPTKCHTISQQRKMNEIITCPYSVNILNDGITISNAENKPLKIYEVFIMGILLASFQLS